jgi:hypothetical protein
MKNDHTTENEDGDGEDGSSYMHMHNERDFLLRCVNAAVEEVITNGWVGRKLLPWIQSTFQEPVD